MSVDWIVIGRGRVGRTLELAAHRVGVQCRGWSRGDAPLSERDVANHAVFLTVPDDAIEDVAAKLAPVLRDAAAVVICSGSISSDVLRDANVGAPVGSVHPLLAIADPEAAVERLSDAAWTVEGDASVVRWATDWLAQLGVTPTEIGSDKKALYHAAAVTSAGLVVAVMDAAFSMAEQAGISPERARDMLLPLARSTLANLSELPVDVALTGPVARGDDAVVAAHRRALGSLDDPQLLEIYDALTRRTYAISGQSEKIDPREARDDNAGSNS